MDLNNVMFVVRITLSRSITMFTLDFSKKFSLGIKWT